MVTVLRLLELMIIGYVRALIIKCIAHLTRSQGSVRSPLKKGKSGEKTFFGVKNLKTQNCLIFRFSQF